MRKYLTIINTKDSSIQMHVSWTMSMAIRLILIRKPSRGVLEITDKDTGEIINLVIKDVRSYTFIRI